MYIQANGIKSVFSTCFHAQSANQIAVLNCSKPF